jgi:hypothetical protein
VFCVNFLQGRFKGLLHTLLLRVKTDMKKEYDRAGDGVDPFFVLIAIMTELLQWWSDVLIAVSLELRDEENNLIGHARKVESDEPSRNRVHIIAAHLQRYESELVRTEDILRSIQPKHMKLGTGTYNNQIRLKTEISQLLSDLKGIQIMLREIKQNTDTLLNLVGHPSQSIFHHNPYLSILLGRTQAVGLLAILPN